MVLLMKELSQFQGKKYLNLETYKKDGEAVRTPVWFVLDDTCLYVHTGAESWKVKRLRHDPKCMLVPCSMSGEPQGTWVASEGEILTEEEQIHRINESFNKKYGFQKAVFGLFRRRNQAVPAILKFKVFVKPA
jgi:PPOX class probable F420-dependent enzyme